MRSRALALVLVVLAGWLAAGCQTPREGEVSTIPWNRPQSWEGAGALGGFQPPGGGGGY